MHKTKRGAAFYVETILLVLFLLFSLTVLVRMLGTAKQLSRQARELSCAVRIAQDAAEQLAACDSREDFAALLGAQEAADGTLRRAYDAQGTPVAEEASGTEEAAAYSLLCRVDTAPEGPGIMLTAHFTVCNEQSVLYELETQKYIGG